LRSRCFTKPQPRGMARRFTCSPCAARRAATWRADPGSSPATSRPDCRPSARISRARGNLPTDDPRVGAEHVGSRRCRPECRARRRGAADPALSTRLAHFLMAHLEMVSILPGRTRARLLREETPRCCGVAVAADRRGNAFAPPRRSPHDHAQYCWKNGRFGLEGSAKSPDTGTSSSAGDSGLATGRATR